jgi:hypothetical protein
MDPLTILVISVLFLVVIIFAFGFTTGWKAVTVDYARKSSKRSLRNRPRPIASYSVGPQPNHSHTPKD